MEAGRNGKEQGLENNLLELIAADAAFSLSLDEHKKAMEPAKYTGRAKEQTEEFIAEVITPVLDENKDLLGMTAEITV